MDVFDLAAVLTLDASSYNSGLKNASSKAASFGSKISSGLSNAAKLGGKALAGATTAAVGFAKSSVSAGGDFDKSMSQVAATMGITNEELNSIQVQTDSFSGTLRDFAQEMGSTTVFSATQAADALNYMALAGYDAQKSAEMLPTVLNLAAAGNMDLAQASDMVTDASSALGLTTEETYKMIDKMAKTSSSTNTSVAQLGRGMLKVGGTARNLAGGTTELSTMLGVLADNGIKGAEGGTHLRNIMLAMNPTTDAACYAWKRLGLSAYDAQGNLRPLPEIFGDLNRAMKGMSMEEKTYLLKDMFNKTDLASVNALLGTTSERFTELASKIDDSTGAAEKMAGVQLDNLSGDITLFKSALEGAQIAISDVLTPTLRQFVQFGSEGLSRLTKAFKEEGLTGAMSEFGVLLSEGLDMVIDMMPGMLKAGMSLLDSLIDGLVNNIPKLSDTALKIMLMIVNSLSSNLPKLIESAIEIIVTLSNGIAGALPKLVPTIVETIIKIATTLIDNVDKLIDSAVAIITALAEGLINSLPILTEKAPVIIQKLVNAITSNLPKLITSAIDIIVTLSNGIAGALPKLVPTVVKTIITIVTTLIDNVDKLIDSAIAIITALAEGLINSLPILIEKAPVIVQKLVNAIVNNAPKLLKAAFTLITTLAKALIDYIPDLLVSIPKIITSLVNGLSKAAPKLLSSALEFIKTLADGVIKYLPKLAAKAPSIIAALVKSLVENLFKIAEVGGKIVIQLTAGLINNFSYIIGKIPGLMVDIVNAFVDAIQDGPSNVGGMIVNGLWNGISSGWEWLLNNVRNLIGNLISAAKEELGIHSPSRVFAQIGEFCVAGFNKGISDLMDTSMITKSINASVNAVSANVASLDTNSSARGQRVEYNQTINVNQKISTPDELARAVKLESRYGLMRGVSLG